ncbi:hypothetical protein C9374_002468 [Naegleria lovaniensis]|uniref:Protein kinase domain-containing protein n=1 Tax=Naegleria lovaniensis TaxID=51637 RepID=A0AA88KM96_NAELO|nr:uncharacterized protein C9374_002468 [Naegleria lovaniensis]KAG2386724.1 hypothetical protein C9374_002468 [Naegleria lovaniensis]
MNMDTIRIPATVTKDDFEFGQILGEGAFGQVRLCVHKATEVQFAAKILKKEKLIKAKQTKYVKSEKEILLEMDHSNISKLCYTFTDEKRLYFILELITGGELFECIIKSNLSTKELKKVVQFYMAQLLEALIYIHSLHICHRDLKPENLMLNGDGNLKLVDFGIAKKIEKPGPNTFCGTAEYLAPEVVTNNEYGIMVDWWAYGCIIYELFCGKSPFYSSSMAVTCQKIVDRDIFWPKTLPSDAKDLIDGLLCTDPERRLGGVALRKHPFFKGIEWKNFSKIKPPLIPDLMFDNEDRGVGIKMSMFEPRNDQEDVMIQAHVFKARTKSASVQDIIKRSNLLRKLYPQLNQLPERPRPINSRIIQNSENIPKTNDKVEEEEVNDERKGNNPSVPSNFANAGDKATSEEQSSPSSKKQVVMIQSALSMKTPVMKIIFGQGDKVAASSSFQAKAFAITIDHESNIIFNEQKSMTTVSTCNFLEYSPNGEMLVFDMQRHIGLMETKNPKKKPKQLVGHPLPITKVSWHPKSTLLAAGGLDSLVYLWNVESGKPKLQTQIESHKAYISDLQFHPKESLLASASGDCKVIFYDAQSERVVHKFSAHEDAILGVRWNETYDNIFCTWSMDRRLIISDRRTFKPVKILAHSRPIINAEWSKDGTMLATCTRDSIRIWQYSNITSSFCYTNADNLPGELLSFDCTNKYLAVLKCRDDTFPSVIDTKPDLSSMLRYSRTMLTSSQ